MLLTNWRGLLCLLTTGTIAFLLSGWMLGLFADGPITAQELPWRIAAATATSMVLGFITLHVLRRPSGPVADDPNFSKDDYARVGLAATDPDVDNADIYLDLMKRTLINIIYEDRPRCFYNGKDRPVVAERFDLQRRVDGEDAPAEAHTMVGWKRLTNLQTCAQSILNENVPGDLLEAGVLRGGASIFLRATLRARHVSDRRVIACDTFREQPPVRRTLLVDAFLGFAAVLASIPSKSFHRRLYRLLELVPENQRSFPITEDPSDELIEFTMFLAQNAGTLMTNHKDQTGLAAVQSHFARYGLLDDQTLFLQGFFSETLPTAPIEQLAMIRLDGDLYESTMDVLNPMYPKLSPGGYCIVDDYYAFEDCRRAVDDYRRDHGVTDSLIPIDGISVYWRKGVPTDVQTDRAEATQTATVAS